MPPEEQEPPEIQEPEVVEVEVERLPEKGQEPTAGPDPTARLTRAISPILAGVLVDGLDAITRGPLTILGLIGGLPLGYWLGRSSGLSKKHSRYLALVVAGYCLLPITAAFPIGIITGIFIQFVRSDPTKGR